MPTTDKSNTEHTRRQRCQVMANGYFPRATPKDTTTELNRKFGDYKYFVDGKLTGNYLPNSILIDFQGLSLPSTNEGDSNYMTYSLPSPTGYKKQFTFTFANGSGYENAVRFFIQPVGSFNLTGATMTIDGNSVLALQQFGGLTGNFSFGTVSRSSVIVVTVLNPISVSEVAFINQYPSP